MIDIETRLREGLEAFAAETTARVTPPTVAAISQCAEPRSRRRAWPKVTAVVVGGALLSVGVASAAGLLPASVESKLSEFRSWGFHANGGASRVAALTQGGSTYEVWLAPLAGGGQCAYDRVVTPDGRVHHGNTEECDVTAFPATSFKYLFYRLPQRAGDEMIVAGLTPPAASEVEFELADGTTTTVAEQPNGWFVTVLPGIQTSKQVVAIRALDADGRVVSTLPGDAG